MKKKILVVSQYFYPEQFRINDMCSEWVESGYDVTVLTGIPNYPTGNFFEGYGIFKRRIDKVGNVNVIRLPIVPRKKNSIFLALNYLSFLVSGYLWAIFTKKKFDEVFIYEVSPMTQAIPGVKYAKKHNVQSIIYVMDLWPDNFIELSGIKNKIIINQITKMVKYIYKNVSTIFISSPGFNKKICDLGDYSSKIVYWPQYAESFYRPTIDKSECINFDPEKFNITFAGNIGYAQGLEILPEVAQKLEEEKLEVHFNIIGNGRFKSELIKIVNNNNLNDYFTFYEPVEAIEIPKILGESDAALVSLSNNPLFSLTIPAKVQSILATGTPIIASADGVLENIIRESGAGVWSEAGNAQKLVENIRRMLLMDEISIKKMKNNALSYSNEEFLKQKLMLKLYEYWD